MEANELHLNLRHSISNVLPPAGNSKSGWPWTEGINSLPDVMPDGSQWPKISIITPSYNQAQFIEETIRSILLQGYPNLEYIIMDGGSTDGSIEIIKKYEKWISCWVSEKDGGQSDAIVRGIKRTTGEIVNWLNSDDILLPNALAEVAYIYVSTRAQNLKAVFCGSGLYIDKNRKAIKELPIRSVEISERILPMAPPYVGGIQASWFLTREAWFSLGGIDTKLDYTMDTDLYYRCYKNNFPFYPIESNLAAYRVHQDTKTLNGWEKSIDFKKNFYTRQLSEISPQERRYYEQKVGLLLFGFCLKSITAQDKLPSRYKKIIKGLRIYPPGVTRRHCIKQIIKSLIM
jgi:glycosyltransferase involved in cell wall biosynthesis